MNQFDDYSYEQTETRGSNYWWDGIYFKEDWNTMPYAHPDKNVGNVIISPIHNWVGVGDQLFHIQFDDSTSSALLSAGVGLVGIAIGAAIGTAIFPGIGSIGGAIIGWAISEGLT